MLCCLHSCTAWASQSALTAPVHCRLVSAKVTLFLTELCLQHILCVAAWRMALDRHCRICAVSLKTGEESLAHKAFIPQKGCASRLLSGECHSCPTFPHFSSHLSYLHPGIVTQRLCPSSVGLPPGWAFSQLLHQPLFGGPVSSQGRSDTFD